MAKATAYDAAESFKFGDFTKAYTDFNKFASDYSKLFVNGKAPTFDFEAAFSSQRKNVEALTAANQLAFQGAQAVFRRQVELVREAFDSFGSVSKEFTAPGSTEEKLVKQAEFGKAAFESALANAREIGELVQKTSEDAIELISKRVAANFDEVKAALKTKPTKN
ncbi:MAG TPA: TIGR01841 family phasin [Dongiaceae bacterium]|jgi:phasin family protein